MQEINVILYFVNEDFSLLLAYLRSAIFWSLNTVLMYLIIQYTPNLVSVGVYDSPAYSAEAYVEFTTDTPSSWIDIQVE